MNQRSLILDRHHVPLGFCVIFLLVVLACALLGSLITPHDPNLINHLATLQGASSAHPLGTDEFGRDILSRLIIGIRPTIIVAFGATALAALGGVPLGMIAGYAGRVPEFLIMRSCDVLLSFPPILLALLAVGFWKSGVTSLTIVIGTLYVPHFARITHAATLQIVHQEFVEAERSLGARPTRLLLRILLPNILSPIVIQATLTVAAAILLESGLSFLGLGIVPPEASWGQMIGSARGYLARDPMYLIWPSLCLAITVLSINLIGDALRDLLDPRLR
jgi:peptide/nickel transport system permease protein